MDKADGACHDGSLAAENESFGANTKLLSGKAGEESIAHTSVFWSEDITVFCAFRLTFDGIDKLETTTLPLVYFYLTQQCFRHYHQGQKKI